MLLISTLAAFSLFTFADEPFRGRFYSKESGITLCLDLYGDSLLVPHFEFLGPVGGYMVGDTNENLYGTWMLLSHKVDGNKALLRMTNDIGSDAQDILFTQLTDSTFRYRAVGGNEVKKAIRHKLYKTEAEMLFERVGTEPGKSE
ncbi:MAG: hypothetical protein IJ692_08080 [Alloprevotella sp.]|nr:hypothetical protein [Alloprevotella sp.]MBR1652002.1 hypothetical protein [Alloprevotella sp.]MBR1653325.1 hypothetical protein [Alloprevotella sp.]